MKILKHNLLREHSPPKDNTYYNNKTILYMKHILSFSFLLLVANSTFGQLTKGHWLVGGSGSFYSYKNEIISNVSTTNGKYTQINISPNIGYFLADKFALGMNTTVTSIKGDDTVVGGNGSGNSSSQRYLIGLFGRYYLLDKEKQMNILVNANYQTGIIRGQNDTKGTLKNFSIAAGPVIYFNSSVGIEFLLGYNSEFEKYTSQVFSEHKNGFLFSIGLQIHLIK